MRNGSLLAVLLLILVSGAGATAQGQEQPPPASERYINADHYQQLFPQSYGQSGGDTYSTYESNDPDFRPLTRDEASVLLGKHIEKRSGNPRGLFPIEDERTGKEWLLRVVTWQSRPLIQLSSDRIAIRTHFVAEDGAKVIVEFVFKRGWWWGTWGVSGSNIYSVDGVPRWSEHYSFEKKKWIRKPVEPTSN